jgi:Ca2+-binding EF-hand superfamily protein
MNERLNQFIACFVLNACCVVSPTLGQSNSKGENSSVVVGILTGVNASGNEFKVAQTDDLVRTLHTDTKSKFYFVGIADKDARNATVGFGVKASCDKDGRIKTISFTPPIPEPEPLGENRLSMTPAELFMQVDTDDDGQVGYGEFSRSIYHSPKHGPDHFRKADGDSDGGLNSAEFRKALERVSWWSLSRKTPATWFQEADADGDEKLSQKEFAHICASGNHIGNVFKRADGDHSGDISSREATAYIRSVTHGKQRKKMKRKRD